MNLVGSCCRRRIVLSNEIWSFFNCFGLLSVDGVVLEQPPRKRSLADRLGRVVGDEEQTGQHPRNGQLEASPRDLIRSPGCRAAFSSLATAFFVHPVCFFPVGLKPIRERLGFQADAEAPVWPGNVYCVHYAPVKVIYI